MQKQLDLVCGNGIIKVKQKLNRIVIVYFLFPLWWKISGNKNKLTIMKR